MSLAPGDHVAETIPGDPSHTVISSANAELGLVTTRGGGQPYLLAIKLRGEQGILHLRAYMANPNPSHAWASTALLPREIQDLLSTTSQNSALAWLSKDSGGTPPDSKVLAAIKTIFHSGPVDLSTDGIDVDIGEKIATHLLAPPYGLFFDPDKNHDAWFDPASVPAVPSGVADNFLRLLRARFSSTDDDDASAERLEVSDAEVEAFRERIEDENFEVDDAHATVKTRGSAQRAFSESVKANYGYRCAVTGMSTTEFLVAAHIVPWSVDKTIRLDPSNGICLSPLMDRAFEYGFVAIEDDLTVNVRWDMVGTDSALKAYLMPYDGSKLRPPTTRAPKARYLELRRNLTK